jgi:hypothetical protein
VAGVRGWGVGAGEEDVGMGVEVRIGEDERIGAEVGEWMRGWGSDEEGGGAGWGDC